jgi:hypothetical protein
MIPATRLLSAALVAAALVLVPSFASAFERQWHAGADVGYNALLFQGGRVGHGVGGGLHLAYGITDAWNLLGEFNTTYHPSGRFLLAGGGAGVGYVVDILQWVPHVGAVIGASDIANTGAQCSTPKHAACNSAWATLAIPFGIDYTISRSFSVGLGGRYQLLLSHVGLVNAIGAFARVEYLWGY